MAARAPVFRACGNQGRIPVVIEETFEGVIHFISPAGSNQCLCQFLVGRGQSRVQLYRAAKGDNGCLIVALLPFQVTQVFVKPGVIRRDLQSKLNLLLCLLEFLLLDQRMTKQLQVRDRCSINDKKITTNELGFLRVASLYGFHDLGQGFLDIWVCILHKKVGLISVRWAYTRDSTSYQG